MKSFLIAGVALALVSAASTSLAAKTNYKAELEGSAAGSNATGTGNFTYDDVTKKLCGKVTFTALTGGAVTGTALKNQNDQALVKTLTPGASPLDVEVALTDGEAALLQNPGLYIVIQTATNPAPGNGEINGELNPDPQGAEQPCGGGGGDAGADSGADSGTDAGSSSSSSSSSSSGSSGTSGTSGGTSGSSAPPTENAPAAKKDDGGCSSTGATSSGGLALAALAALVVVARGRARRR